MIKFHERDWLVQQLVFYDSCGTVFHSDPVAAGCRFLGILTSVATFSFGHFWNLQLEIAVYGFDICIIFITINIIFALDGKLHTIHRSQLKFWILIFNSFLNEDPFEKRCQMPEFTFPPSGKYADLHHVRHFKCNHRILIIFLTVAAKRLKLISLLNDSQLETTHNFNLWEKRNPEQPVASNWVGVWPAARTI